MDPSTSDLEQRAEAAKLKTPRRKISVDGRVWETPWVEGMVFPNFDIKFRTDERRVDYSDLIVEHERVEQSDIEKEVTQRINAEKARNKSAEYWKHLGFKRMQPHSNSLAALLPRNASMDFITTKNPNWWSFIATLRNRLVKDNDDDDFVDYVNLLGVNYNVPIPWPSIIYHSKSYQAEDWHYPKDALSAYGEAASVWEWATFLRSESFTDEELLSHSPRLKPGTSIGYPWTTVDGVPVTKGMIYFGAQYKLAQMFQMGHPDYYGIKKGWVSDPNGSSARFHEQWENRSRWNDPDYLIQAFYRGTCTVSSMNFRWTSPDTIKGKDLWSLDMQDEFECKNRYITRCPALGVFDEYLLDTTKLSRRQQLVYGTRGRNLRLRVFLPSDNMTAHQYGNMLAKLLCKDSLEDGLSGFPADRPEMLAKVKRFYDAYSGKYDIYVLRADRTNAEKFVSSNFEMLSPLFDRSVWEYLRLTASSYSPSEQGMMFVLLSYCSAVWYTSYGHIHVGNCEAGLLFSEIYGILDPHARRVAMQRYATALYLGAAEVVLQDGKPPICPFAGTDDIMVPFAWEKGAEPPSVDSRWANSKINVEIVRVATGFGLKIDESGNMAPNQANSIGKLFFQERPGWGDHDAFSALVKARSIDPAIRGVVDETMRQFDLGDTSGYQEAEKAFFNSLSRDGFLVEDFYNEFSPSERRVYGEYVDVNQLGKSHRTPLDVAKRMLQELRTTIFEAREYGQGVQLEKARNILDESIERREEMAGSWDRSIHGNMITAADVSAITQAIFGGTNVSS